MQKKYQLIAGLLAIFVFAYILFDTVYAGLVLQREVEDLVQREEAALLEIAEIIDRDGLASDAEALVLDCSVADRERFDTLLSSLSTLSGAELVAVDDLFDKCGNYYALRRAVMVDRLTQQYEKYETAVNLQRAATPFVEPSTNVATWNDIVRLEQERSEASGTLVSLQKNIITALRENSTEREALTASYVSQAEATKISLLEKAASIDALRASLE